MTKDSKNLKRKVVHAGGWQIAKRVAKSLPYVGTALAIGLVGHDIKKKGLAKGVLNSGLDAIPVIGAVKNVTEFFVGDFISDKATLVDNRIRKPTRKNPARKTTDDVL